MAQWIALVVTLLLAGSPEIQSAQNLMQNPGFESGMTGHWEAAGFTMTISNDAHSGTKAGKFTNRYKYFYTGIL